jgi:hypothetical protein
MYIKRRRTFTDFRLPAALFFSRKGMDTRYQSDFN